MVSSRVGDAGTKNVMLGLIHGIVLGLICSAMLGLRVPYPGYEYYPPKGG